MSLSLISAGICFDLTLNGIKEMEKCDEIYAEIYTSPIEKKSIEKLEEKINKKITLIGREKVESNYLVGKAVHKKIGLIVVGDSLIATTHITLLIDCKNKGIEIKVIHNSSIISAAMGKSGLQAYRFGKSVTLPYWKKNYEPTSPINVIEENLKRNLHTLLFLDIDKEKGPMKARDGIEMIRKIEERSGKNGIVKNIIVLSRVGYEDEKIIFGTIDELENKKENEFGKTLFIFIIPAKLHEIEKEYLDNFSE